MDSSAFIDGNSFADDNSELEELLQVLFSVGYSAVKDASLGKRFVVGERTETMGK